MPYYINTTATFHVIERDIAETLWTATTGRGALRVGGEIVVDCERYLLDYISFSSYNPIWRTRGISIYYRRKQTIIRISDHWSQTSKDFNRSKKLNCRWISSCWWTLDDATQADEFEGRGHNCGKFNYRLLAGKCALRMFRQNTPESSIIQPIVTEAATETI